MVELFQMKCFVAVAEELHFGRAAVRLFMTQPPLSRQIQLLEAGLGVQLLERSSRSVRLTAAGKVFYEDARTIMALADKAQVAARRTASGEAGCVVIGYTALAGYSLIPDLVSVLKKRFPDIDIVLREMVSSEQQEALAAHTIDLAFMRPVMSTQAFGYALAAREPMMLAVPASHPLAGKPRIVLGDMAQQPFIMYAPQEAKYFHERIAQLFAATGVCPRYVQHIAQTHTILALVKAGIGLAIVPAAAQALRLDNIVYRPLWRKDVFAELYLAWPLEHRNPALDAIRQFVVDGAAGGASSAV